MLLEYGTFEGDFISKVVHGYIDEMQIESCQVVSTYVYLCFFANLRSRLMFSHQYCLEPNKNIPPFCGILRNPGLRGTIKGGEPILDASDCRL